MGNLSRRVAVLNKAGAAAYQTTGFSGAVARADISCCETVFYFSVITVIPGNASGVIITVYRPGRIAVNYGAFLIAYQPSRHI
jgi:hypothetical protein